MITTSPSTLREEEWLQLLLIAVEANGIMITDSNGIIKWVNPAFTKLTGYAVEDVVGKNPRFLKSGMQKPSFYENLWTTISSGKRWNGELINRRKDGSHYIEDMTISPIMTDGVVSHFVAIKQDITSQRTAEEKLKESETNYSALLENLLPLMTELKEVTGSLEQARSEMQAILNATNEAFLLLSLEHQILWNNRAFERMFSLHSEDLGNKNFHDLQSHWHEVFDEPTMIEDIIEKTDATKGIEVKKIVSQKWPQKRELEVYSVSVETTNSDYLGQLYVFRDVTHERKIERMKSEFVSLVSHEFRTPLTSIRGYTELLLDEDVGDLQNDQIGFLSTILRNVNHLSTLVEETLDVSRIEAGAVKLTITKIDIETLIHESAANLQPQIQAKKQKLEISVKEGLPRVEGDRQRICQVLLNLFSNAYKYTPSGGKITVTVNLKGNMIKIDVKDTGVGLSIKDQEKLFTKFFRSDNPETRDVGGTGLGLWISRSLVEMHGGQLSVKSKLGKGSTFTLTLPI
jgi:two-component system sensor histidine kinase/response regulator